MLVSLDINNIAVARSLSVEFTDGFTVLTGETGAGKSIIIDSVNLLLGGKYSREIIRSGETKASVSALFTGIGENRVAALAEVGVSPDENGELFMVRTITSDGRSSAKINNHTVPLSTLRDAGAVLVAIHGQNDSRALLDKVNHLALTDEYIMNGGNTDAARAFAEYAEVYRKLTDVTHRLKELQEASREKSMLTDILRYQVNEIDSAKLSAPDEETRLEELKHKTKNAERIRKQTSLVYRALASSEKGSTASYLIEKAVAALSTLRDVIPDAPEMAETLESYRLEIVDIAERVREAAGDDDTDPEKKLNAIESRLNLISKLRGKYGEDIAAILKFRNEAAARLDDLESYDIRISELTAEAAAATENASRAAEVLTKLRADASKKIAEGVCASLAYLDMPKIRFNASIRRLTEVNGGARYCPTGADDIEFLISTNPGEPPAPLAKIASGGELSRIMLALKSVLTDKSGADTLIFDEIDTGVSGKTSQKIGILLKKISREANTQTLCVTHSAQIASVADNHLLVAKSEVDGRAETSVKTLDADGRVGELARIIGGINITDIQLGAARQMLDEGTQL